MGRSLFFSFVCLFHSLLSFYFLCNSLFFCCNYFIALLCSIKINKQTIDLMRTVVSGESFQKPLRNVRTRRKTKYNIILWYWRYVCKDITEQTNCKSIIMWIFSLSCRIRMNAVMKILILGKHKFFQLAWRAYHYVMCLCFYSYLCVYVCVFEWVSSLLHYNNCIENCNGIICESNGLGVGKHSGWFQCILIT